VTPSSPLPANLTARQLARDNLALTHAGW